MRLKSKRRISRDEKLNKNAQEDFYENLIQLKQEKMKSKATFGRDKNLLFELLNEKLPV